MWPQKSLAPIVIIVRQTVYLMLSVIWVRQEYFWLYLGKTFHFMIRDVEVAKKYFHSQRINHSKATCTKSQLTNVFLFSTIGVTVIMRSNFYFLHTVFPWIVSAETYSFLSLWNGENSNTVFPHIVAAATILFWIHKSLKISYSFLIKLSLM